MVAGAWELVSWTFLFCFGRGNGGVVVCEWKMMETVQVWYKNALFVRNTLRQGFEDVYTMLELHVPEYRTKHNTEPTTKLTTPP